MPRSGAKKRKKQKRKKMTDNYLRQSAYAEGKTLDLTTALFKKLAELHEKYGVLLDNSIHGELIIEFPAGTPPATVEIVMKELYDVKMG